MYEFGRVTVGSAISLICLAWSPASCAPPEPESPQEPFPSPVVRFDPIERDIEGWTVHVEPSLISDDPTDPGGRALRMLADHLNRIAILMPEERLKELRTLEIWIEAEHPVLKAMQYHPSRAWLEEHGHDPRLAKKVHIPRASALVDRGQLLKHPMVVLHELAHAYHDQFIDFNNPRIIEVYETARSSGTYDDVLLFTGDRVRHYGMNNHKEYFAEATEAYFYRNDFYPFVRAELAEHDPAMHDLLAEVWGPLQ